MKFVLSLLLFFSLTSYCGAQSAEVIWTGTTTIDLFRKGGRFSSGQEIKTVGYRAVENSLFNKITAQPPGFGGMLFEAFRRGDVVAYRDELNTVSVSKEELTSFLQLVDTVVILDAKTYEETRHTVARDVSAEDFSKLRLNVRLSMYEDGRLTQKVNSLAISYGDIFEGSAIFYFPVETLNSVIDPGEARWNYVVRASVNVPLGDRPDRFTLDTDWREIVRQLTVRAASVKDGTIEEPEEWGPITDSSRVRILEPDVDSSSASTKEKTSNAAAEPLWKQVDHLKLHYLIGWDGKAGRVSVSPIGYSPAISLKSNTWNGGTTFRELYGWSYPWYRRTHK